MPILAKREHEQPRRETAAARRLAGLRTVPTTSMQQVPTLSELESKSFHETGAAASAAVGAAASVCIMALWTRRTGRISPPIGGGGGRWQGRGRWPIPIY
jgi:hypothetical protein